MSQLVKGHDGIVMSGSLAALGLHPDGIVRRHRANLRELAQESAAHIQGSMGREFARLRRLQRRARSRAQAIAVEIRALRHEQLVLRYRAPRIEDHFRDLLRGHPFADHCFDAAFAPNLIVNAGEAFLVDAWQNLVELENMKFHGMGTGTVNPAEGDTALGTELTTEYNPDNTRATGSLTEASASVFRSVGTNTIDSGTPAVTEWGLLSQAATGGGTLWSRVEFAAINLVANDSIQFTYDLTVE